MTAAPVATQYTYDFVCKTLPRGARTVLEIGCGNGELAARLVNKGLTVIAIDAEADCVAAAIERGVNAQQLIWPAQLDLEFDAVLFTRSLHHVHALSDGVVAAQEQLRAGGRMIVEDFHAEGVSTSSNEWFEGLTRILATAGAFADKSSLVPYELR